MKNTIISINYLQSTNILIQGTLYDYDSFSNQTKLVQPSVWVTWKCFVFMVYCLTFQHSDLQTDPKLYFWDIETDSLSYFNFDTGKGEQDDYPTEQIEGMHSGSALEMSDADRLVVYTFLFQLVG